jgi:hypothetical protein
VPAGAPLSLARCPAPKAPVPPDSFIARFHNCEGNRIGQCPDLLGTAISPSSILPPILQRGKSNRDGIAVWMR